MNRLPSRRRGRLDTLQVNLGYRARVAVLDLTFIELPTLWDVDTEADLSRCQTLFPEISL